MRGEKWERGERGTKAQKKRGIEMNLSPLQSGGLHHVVRNAHCLFGHPNVMSNTFQALVDTVMLKHLPIALYTFPS